MQDCSKCKGTGRMTLSVTVVNGPTGKQTKEPPLEMECLYCRGVGLLTDAQVAANKRMDAIWCKCGNPSERTTYHDDVYKNGERISKHHWTCDDCSKVTQIG